MTKGKRCIRREVLMEALESGSVPFKAHLKECNQCRELFDFLSKIGFPKRRPLEKPSEELITRFALIPLSVNSRKPGETVVGTVVFDSWSHLPAIHARDNAKGMERRMRLKAGQIVLELVAEHQADRWELTARVYDNRKVAAGFILKAGRRIIQAGTERCFFWSSRTPPRRIRLLSPQVLIDFGPLNWK